MKIAPHAIHVWSASLLISKEDETYFLTLLDDHEKQRAGRFHKEEHRRRFIAAHGILRSILSAYLQIQAKDIQFSFTTYHKPYLDNQSLAFNLSHSDEWAMIAITEQRAIGIDIEKIEPRDIDAIAKRFFHESEIQLLQTLSDEKKLQAFYGLWTRKEAFLKATGMGLHVPLHTVIMPLYDNAVVSFADKSWTVSSLSPPNLSYACSLACEGTMREILIQEFILKQFLKE